MNLELERRQQQDETPTYGGEHASLMVTPPIDEGYWAYRVKLSDTQAIVGFPKFMTVGIGFAVEDYDWNVNLPYSCDADEIYEHVAKNKGDDAITREDCIEAIRLIQAAVLEDVPGASLR